MFTGGKGKCGKLSRMSIVRKKSSLQSTQRFMMGLVTSCGAGAGTTAYGVQHTHLPGQEGVEPCKNKCLDSQTSDSGKGICSMTADIL